MKGAADMPQQTGQATRLPPTGGSAQAPPHDLYSARSPL
jgi:hypothetical protein